MLRHKFYSYFVLTVLFVVFLSLSCRQQQPIKVGLSINISGIGGAAGEDIRDGALLAVEEINRSGGIHGRPLTLLVRDDKNTSEGIRAADESLLREKVVAIIGHSYSSSTMTAYPIVTSNNTLLLTAYTATTKLSGRDDLFIRTSVDCALYGRKTSTLLNRKKISSVAVFMDMTNPDFVLDYVTQVKLNFGGTLKQVHFSSRKQADWDTIIPQLLDGKPEAILFLSEASMTGVALQKLEAAGYDGARIATIWAQTPGLMKYAGGSAEGLSIVSYMNPENSRPDYQAFSSELESMLHKRATARSSRSYEIVMILADAMERSANLTAAELKKALLAKEYRTLLGRVRFDKYGDVLRPIYEIVVKDNQFHNNGEI